MTTIIKAYANCDDVYVVWKTAQPVQDCRGFALFRRRNGEEKAVSTWVGFAEDEDAKSGTFKPSTEWPIQKFMWTDYMARSGDKLQYKVVPMVGSRNNLTLAEASASDWSDEVAVTARNPGGVCAYFNRGIVASQWLARRLGDEAAAESDKQKKLSAVINDVNDKTRQFLSGEIRVAINGLFKRAKEMGGSIYAVLYELDEPELEAALASLGKRANVILANGSTKKAGEDQNHEARAALKSKIKLYDRMLPTGRLGHNKFLVLCDANDQPLEAWSGSTNWTKTGLCTQANNGILFDNRRIAKVFKTQWDALKQAKNGFPPNLIETNSAKKRIKLKNSQLSVWFTPVGDEEDLTQATELINGAEQGIMFLMFNPGPSRTLLNAIVERNSPASPYYNPELYIHGVLNQDPSTKTTPVVGLFHRGEFTPAPFEVLLPAAITKRLKFWIPEIKKKQSAFAMVHSKVIVIDPFGKHPVVMTGSHNLGPKASSKNDDNLLIIENDPPLAAAYSVNIMSIYNQYRWRYSQLQSKKPSKWIGLVDNDEWQEGYFKGAKQREIDFWLGQL